MSDILVLITIAVSIIGIVFLVICDLKNSIKDACTPQEKDESFAKKINVTDDEFGFMHFYIEKPTYDAA